MKRLPPLHRFEPHDPARSAALLDRQVDVAVRTLPDVPDPADAVSQSLFLLDPARPVDARRQARELPSGHPPTKKLPLHSRNRSAVYNIRPEVAMEGTQKCTGDSMPSPRVPAWMAVPLP